MLIILEGSDLAGKTTVADQLADLATDLGHPVHRLHAGWPTGPPLEEYELTLHRHWRDVALDPHDLLIIDRWHLGETVYGPILRGRTDLGHHQFDHVERYLDTLGATRVVVDVPDEVRRHRYAQRGDDMLPLNVIMEAARLFRSKATRHHWRTLISPAKPDDIRVVMMWAGVDNTRARTTLDFPGYVGSSWPMALFVGDEPNGHVPGEEPPNPAFMPYWRNSGHYLLEALDEACVRSWGLANANDGTDPYALWGALDRPRVVALGRRAEKRLRDASVPHVHVPHPQYARRFQYRQHGWYAGLLRGAVSVPTELTG